MIYLDSTHISAMKQCLGFDESQVRDGFFEAKRNYSLHRSVNPTFEDLVAKGYVDKNYCCDMVNYKLTSMGISFIEDTFHCKIKIIKENKEDY